MSITANQSPAARPATRLSAAKPSDRTDILLDAGTNEVEILVFRVADLDCGVNVAKVREVHTVERMTFLPRFPNSVDGVIQIRDEVVPAIDLQSYICGSPLAKASEDERHLLLEYNQHLIAYRVQAVQQVHRISWKEVLPVPDGLGEQVPLTGILLLENKIISILDFESIAAKLHLTDGTEFSKTAVTSEAKKCPVVFADDSAMIRAMMISGLQQAGYTNVTIFEDGQEAWEYLRGLAEQNGPESIYKSVSAVITDIEMPRMDGFTLTKHVRANPVLKDLPVILFSSLVSEDNEKKGRQVGATVQIAKPNWEDLSRILVETLQEVMNS